MVFNNKRKFYPITWKRGQIIHSCFKTEAAMYFMQTMLLFSEDSFKDARSISLYPYNRSQIMQYVKYTKSINITKGIAKLCDKKYVFGQKEKNQQQQNKKSNIKTHAGNGNRTRDLLLPERMRYHYTAESTESTDCRQVI